MKAVNNFLSASKLDATFAIWAELDRKTRIQIRGNSMYPFIKDGEHLAIHHGQDQFLPGDILVFRNAGSLIAHRLIHIWTEDGKTKYLTKGDANRIVDSPLEHNQIVGRVESICRPNHELNLDSALWRRIGHLIAARSKIRGSHKGSSDTAQEGRLPNVNLVGKVIRRVARILKYLIFETFILADRLLSLRVFTQ